MSTDSNQSPAARLMTDVVEFESPGGSVGRLVNALVLARYMTKLLKQREHRLVDALTTPEG